MAHCYQHRPLRHGETASFREEEYFSSGPNNYVALEADSYNSYVGSGHNHSHHHGHNRIPHRENHAEFREGEQYYSYGSEREPCAEKIYGRPEHKVVDYEYTKIVKEEVDVEDEYNRNRFNRIRPAY